MFTFKKMGLTAILLFIGCFLYGSSAALKIIDFTSTGDSLLSAGFSEDENLITPTNTLLKGYRYDQNAHFVTNHDTIYSDNLCESTNDAVDPAPTLESNSELTEVWVTWDTNYIYFAVKGQAMGRHNLLMAFIDTNPVTGIFDFNFANHSGAWKRDIIFEDFKPNIYLGFWCENYSANYAGDDADLGGARMQIGNGEGSNWLEFDSYDQCSSPTSTDGAYYSWYNGTLQSDPTKRNWIFKISWATITNNQYSQTNPTNLTIKFSFASMGPDDYSSSYDIVPNNLYKQHVGAQETLQNNFFSIKVTDANGDILMDVSPKTSTTVAHYPYMSWQTNISVNPILESPSNNIVDLGTEVTFKWQTAQSSSTNISYELLLSTNSNFTNGGVIIASNTTTKKSQMLAGVSPVLVVFLILIMISAILTKKKRGNKFLIFLVFFLLFGGLFFACSDDVTTPTEQVSYITRVVSNLAPQTTYYWKVHVTDEYNNHAVSETRVFTTR